MTTSKVRTALAETDEKGAFKRNESVYRNWIKKGSEFEPEGGLSDLLWHGFQGWNEPLVLPATVYFKLCL